MATKGLNPNLRAILTAKLAPAVEAGAKTYAKRLEENVSAGSRSGIQYRSLPRQSSAPGEFPQEQSAGLKESVDARPTDNPLAWRGGFFDQPQKKLDSLEFGTEFMEERAPAQRTADQPETRQAMLEAARKAGRG